MYYGTKAYCSIELAKDVGRTDISKQKLALYYYCIFILYFIYYGTKLLNLPFVSLHEYLFKTKLNHQKNQIGVYFTTLR